jgi:hypothetical protein
LSYPLFLVVGIAVACLVGALLAGPLSVLSVVGFWTSHYFYLEWRHNSAPLAAMSDSELFDVLDWWTGRGPFGRNTPDLFRVRLKGNRGELTKALRRVIAIYEETILRSKRVGLITADHEYKRNQLLDELERLSRSGSEV